MTEDEIRKAATEQNKTRILQFMENMEEAGLEIRHYRGRCFWEGPAVVVSDLQQVLSETKVPCQWDHMGMDMVIYPKQSLDRDAA